MHKRQAIRNTIAGLISANVPEFFSNVFAGRYYVISEFELPACIVNIDGETSELGTTMVSPRLSERVLVIKVDFYVRGHGDLGAVLADLSLAVEREIAIDATFGGLALDSMLTSYAEEMSGDQNSSSTAHKTAYAELTYNILYDVPENNPEEV